MATDYLASKLAINLQLIQPEPAPTGLGPALLLMDRAAGAIGPDGIAFFTSASGVDAAEAAGDLGADDATHLRAMLAQNRRGARVYVAAYDGSETQSSAVFEVETNDDTETVAIVLTYTPVNGPPEERTVNATAGATPTATAEAIETALASEFPTATVVEASPLVTITFPAGDAIEIVSITPTGDLEISGTATPPGETPADALDRVVAAELAQLQGAWVTTTDKRAAALRSVAAWVAQDGRDVSWAPALQSADSGLVTSGFPASLLPLQQRGVMLDAHQSDAAPQAAAFAGLLAGFDLTRGAIGSEAFLLGVDLPTFDAQELELAGDNNAGVLRKLAPGATANQRARRGTKTAGGLDISAWTSSRWVRANVRNAMLNYIARKLQTGAPMLNSPDGRGEVASAIEARLSEVAAQGAPSRRHLTPGTFVDAAGDEVALPSGYRVETFASGANIGVQVDFLVAGQAERFTIELEGLVTT
jgi:hypothetical protein